jgi:hypothetical protein
MVDIVALPGGGCQVGARSLLLVIVSLHLLGNGLRDVPDPRHP